MATAALVGTQVLGTIMSAQGAAQSGDAQLAEARYRAAQSRQAAGQEIAAGTAAMADEAMKTKLLQSRALAVAASSGAGALDPTVVNLVSGIAKVGKYNEGMTMYNAKERANSLTNQASAAEYGGLQAQRASRYKATSTILSGASSLFSKYGTSFTAK